MIELSPGYEMRDGADPVAAHAFLTESYWAKGRSFELVRRSLEGSMAISVWFAGNQVAMARAVSDEATFAYLQDVYVLEAHRGKGLSKAMVGCLLDHPRFGDVSRWALFTKDAQALYAQFGFYEYPYPERMMILDETLRPA